MLRSEGTPTSRHEGGKTPATSATDPQPSANLSTAVGPFTVLFRWEKHKRLLLETQAMYFHKAFRKEWKAARQRSFVFPSPYRSRDPSLMGAAGRGAASSEPSEAIGAAGSRSASQHESDSSKVRVRLFPDSNSHQPAYTETTTRSRYQDRPQAADRIEVQVFPNLLQERERQRHHEDPERNFSTHSTDHPRGIASGGVEDDGDLRASLDNADWILSELQRHTTPAAPQSAEVGSKPLRGNTAHLSQANGAPPTLHAYPQPSHHRQCPQDPSSASGSSYGDADGHSQLGENTGLADASGSPSAGVHKAGTHQKSEQASRLEKARHERWLAGQQQNNQSMDPRGSVQGTNPSSSVEVSELRERVKLLEALLMTVNPPTASTPSDRR
jgi:hypothetical protein